MSFPAGQVVTVTAPANSAFQIPGQLNGRGGFWFQNNDTTNFFIGFNSGLNSNNGLVVSSGLLVGPFAAGYDVPSSAGAVWGYSVAGITASTRAGRLIEVAGPK